MMTENDVWIHEQLELLKKPSFIKNIPPQLLENSASWLIKRLSEFSAAYSEDDLDSIFNMFEEYWAKFTEIEAEEEIEKHSLCSPMPDGIIARFDYKDSSPNEFHFDNEQVILGDKESIKNQICDEFDTLNPTSLERFQVLLSFTDWTWVYTTQLGDEIEVEPFEVAIVIAVEMLGFYLQSLIHKAEKDHSGYLAFDIDEVHQAFHLANLLISEYELKSTTKRLQSDIPKKFISERAAKGGKARAVRYSKIREHIIEAYESRKADFDSIRHASLLLAAEAEEFCKQRQIGRLATANAQRTIYEWLRKYEKQRNI